MKHFIQFFLLGFSIHPVWGSKQKVGRRFFAFEVGSHTFILYFYFCTCFCPNKTKKTHPATVRIASMLSSIYCKHSTANAAQSALHNGEKHVHISNVRACRSEIDNASKQTELARATSCRRACISTFRCVPKTNKEIESCWAKKT